MPKQPLALRVGTTPEELAFIEIDEAAMQKPEAAVI
jgi:hypothetical protein